MSHSKIESPDQQGEREFTFALGLPRDWTREAPLISAKSTLPYIHEKYLLHSQDGEYTHAYRIQYHTPAGPFHDAKLIGRVLGVGDEDQFYLFDTVTETNLLQLPMEWYFGQLSIFQGLFFVADASSLYCIAPSGEKLWRTSQLGIDGVEVSRFEAGNIFGQGEWDPPGGWRPFILDSRTGKLVG